MLEMFKDENKFPDKPEIEIIDSQPMINLKKIFMVFRTTNPYLENNK